MKPHSFLISLTAAAATWPASGWAQQNSTRGDPATVAAIEQTLVDVIARAERSIVAVARSAPPQPSVLVPQIEDIFGDVRQPAVGEAAATTTGAGVIIDPAGLVLTQFLAVRDGDRHTVTTIDGKIHAATIKAADPRSGLAVLTIAASPREGEAPAEPLRFPALPFGDASKLRKGQFVIAIGNPYAIRSDGEPTASWGTVTNLARKAPAGTNLNDAPGPLDDYRTTIHHLGTLIQTDAKLGWNAGGGALVNLRGELVGLTTTVAAIAGHEQPAGYAIPIDDVALRIIDTLKQGREVEYGLLGVSFRPTDLLARPAATRRDPMGVTVLQVYPGSPAARAGLTQGDVVTHVAGKKVDDLDRLQLAVSTVPPSQTLQIGYRRGDRDATATVNLTKLGVPGHKIVSNRPPNWRGIRVDYATALDALTLAERIASEVIDPEGCVMVAEVEPNSSAWQSGVRPQMFISHVGGERVATPDEFRAAVAAASGEVSIRMTQPIGLGEKVELQIP